MAKYWCVNFESVGCLHHGIRNRLWLMGYQYAKKGADAPGRKAAITRNWKRLEEITVGDKFVAYLPGNKFFATATVIAPRTPKTSGDRKDTISEYLRRGKAYTSGHVYFSPSVAYENFTDECSGSPVRIDVEKWANFVPDGVSVKGPTVPLYKTVYAAFDIDKDRFDSIRSGLSGEPVTTVIPEEVDSSETYLEVRPRRLRSTPTSEVERRERSALSITDGPAECAGMTWPICTGHWGKASFMFTICVNLLHSAKNTKWTPSTTFGQSARIVMPSCIRLRQQ
jgi:hypothetical protein